MNQLKGFDGVRAIACFMVILHHVVQVYNPAYLSSFSYSIWNFLYASQAGVSVFFVLSGALLAYPFFKSFTNNQPMPSIKQYIARRFFRIAPAFYLVLFVSALFSLFFFDSNLNIQFIIRFISGLTFTSAFSAVTIFPTDVNGPLWSIGFEVISYLFLVLFMLVLFKYAKQKSIIDATYLFVAAILVVLVGHLIYLRVIELNQAQTGWEYGDVGGARTWFPYYNVFSLFAHFLIGMLASMVLVMLQNKKQEAHKSFGTIILINTCLLVFLWVFFSNSSYGLFEIQYYWPIFPLYVGSTLLLLPFTTHLADILDNRFFKFTAKISFGLYLWHFLVMKVLAQLYFEQYTPFNASDNLQYFLATAIMLVISYALATLSYYLIELPFIRYSKKILPS